MDDASADMIEGAHQLIALIGGRKDDEAIAGGVLVVRFMAKVEALVDAFKG